MQERKNGDYARASYCLDKNFADWVHSKLSLKKIKDGKPKYKKESLYQSPEML